MGRCSAMALAAARMAMDDAGLDSRAARRARAPRSSSARRWARRSFRRTSDHDWIVDGPERRARVAHSRSTARRSCPSTSRAPSAPEGMVLTLPAACAAGNYAIGFARGPHPRRPRGRRRHRRRGAPPGAAVQRLRTPRGDGARAVPALRSEPPGPLARRRRGPARPRERSARRAARRPPAGRGRRLRPVVRRATTSPARTPTRREASPRCAQAIERSGSRTDDVDFVNAHGTGTRAQRRRRGQGDARRLRRPTRPHLQHEEHARPLHGRGERARGHRLRLDARDRASTRRPSATRRPIPSATSTSWPTSRARGQGRRRPQQLARLRRLQRGRRASRARASSHRPSTVGAA